MRPLILAMALTMVLAVGCSGGDPAQLANPFDPRNAHLDDDNDGVPNGVEVASGGNPRDSDADGDGITDGDDPCPSEKGDGECLSKGVCKGAKAGCPCADQYPATFDGAVEVRCDGLDNDCDGGVDEGDPGGGDDCETSGKGICAPGTKHCVDTGIVCVPDAEATAETCDGLDNDCDGDTDEDNPDGGAGCETGEPGVCQSGTERCVAGEVACVADTDAVAEICDGKDNDCDGSADEEDPGGGGICDTGDDGICKPGVQRCIQGDVLCVADADAGEEVCDGLDNDCDGDTDEEDPLVGAGCPVAEQVGECAIGSRTCVGGELVCVGPGPVDEICDGADNNCDGDTDEDDPEGGAECNTGEDGVCRIGQVHCTNDQLRCERVGAPAEVETCDGFDNDCDGETDEEVPADGEDCDTGQDGVCAAGERICRLGELSCARLIDPDRDLCNGLDDDCDGDTDEDDPDVGEACDTGEVGSCAEGFFECVEDGLACASEIVATDEVCDGEEDEDCDGAVDEDCNGCPDGTVVPAGWACVPSTPDDGFVMGTPDDAPGHREWEVQHVVHISRPFFMMKHELTRAQWQDLASSAPFKQTPCSADCPSCSDCDMTCLNDCPADVSSCWESDDCDGCVRECTECRGECPANGMHWVDALGFANERSTRDGLPSCYELSGEQGDLGVDYWLTSYRWINTFTCEGYRLPTEAEWEWAARAGTTTATWAGDFAEDLVFTQQNRCDVFDNLQDIAWYCGNSAQARPVGGKTPNPWGLYDLAGNVNELVWDFYNPYLAGPLTDPTGGAAPDPQEKVLRGGSYFDSWTSMRSGSRWGTSLGSRFLNNGMRLVRTVPPE